MRNDEDFENYVLEKGRKGRERIEKRRRTILAAAPAVCVILVLGLVVALNQRDSSDEREHSGGSAYMSADDKSIDSDITDEVDDNGANMPTQATGSENEYDGADSNQSRSMDNYITVIRNETEKTQVISSEVYLNITDYIENEGIFNNLIGGFYIIDIDSGLIKDLGEEWCRITDRQIETILEKAGMQ